MKQILLFTTLFFFCLSCNNDDDKGNEPNLLIGKWYYETGNGDEATGCHKQCSIEFTSDGEWFFEAFVGSPPDCSNTESYSGTYTISGDNLNIVLESETIPGTYFVSDDMLVYLGEATFAHHTNISTFDKTPD